jgi:L-rhamnose mutarotase
MNELTKQIIEVSKRNENKMKEIKNRMLQEKEVSEVTTFEKELLFEGMRQASKVDNAINQMAQELANAIWDEKASDTVKEAEEQRTKQKNIRDMAYLIGLDREVKEASKLYYEELVNDWGNPQTKAI